MSAQSLGRGENGSSSFSGGHNLPNHNKKGVSKIPNLVTTLIKGGKKKKKGTEMMKKRTNSPSRPEFDWIKKSVLDVQYKIINMKLLKKAIEYTANTTEKQKKLYRKVDVYSSPQNYSTWES